MLSFTVSMTSCLFQMLFRSYLIHCFSTSLFLSLINYVRLVWFAFFDRELPGCYYFIFLQNLYVVYVFYDIGHTLYFLYLAGLVLRFTLF